MPLKRTMPKGKGEDQFSGEPVRLSVSDFVALINQTLEFAFQAVIVGGEVANFRISKNRWVYFDLKDQQASVRCFGTVYALPGPLEDGMLVEVRGTPRLHPQFGFSVTFASIRPTGEGSIKKASQLLQAKLLAEGLFDSDRKRVLPYPPERIGLITSSESAGYADFRKILTARWRGLEIHLADVQVQGEPAPEQIVRALTWFNQQADAPDIVVLIRGGGSADDLQAFSTEMVVRAVAASRIPTMVAIGHEVDTSLAELAADQRASTPSNAAELLVPDYNSKLVELESLRAQVYREILRRLQAVKDRHSELNNGLELAVDKALEAQNVRLGQQRSLLRALNPAAALSRGFAVVRDGQGKLIRSSEALAADTIIHVKLARGGFTARVTDTEQS